MGPISSPNVAVPAKTGTSHCARAFGLRAAITVGAESIAIGDRVRDGRGMDRRFVLDFGLRDRLHASRSAMMLYALELNARPICVPLTSKSKSGLPVTQ